MEKVNCEICGSNSFKLLFVTKDYNWRLQGEFNIGKCTKCGLVYINPRPDILELKKYYPNIYYTRAYKKTLTHKRKIHLNKIFKIRYNFIKHFKSNGRILDVGCGDGYFLYFIKNRGWETYGVEPSEVAYNFSKEELKLEIYNSDLISANFKSSRYDVITMWEVLEHIPDLNKNLKEVYRLLKDDGIFIASVPNFNSLQKLIFGKYCSHIDVPRHLYHFTTNNLKKLFFNNNFLKVKFYHSLITMRNPNLGYSCSMRYVLSEFNLYPKESVFLKNESNNTQIKNDKKIRYLLIVILHFIEFIIFSIIEIFGFFLGRTETIFVIAKKK